MTAQETNLVNAFETTLNGAIASGANSGIALTDDPGVAAKVYLVFDPDNDSKREVVLWNSGAYTSMSVTRDVDSKHGTDPEHADGTKVRLAVVKQHIEDVHDRLEDIALTGDVTGTLASATQDIATTIAAGAVDFAMINQGDLITQSETITSNDSDTKIPTAAAVKNYADAEAATLTNKTLQDYAETKQVLTSSSGAVAIDLANGNVGTITLTENITAFNFTNVPSTFSTFQLYITQHASSNKTVAISCTVNGGGAANALTSGAGGYTVTTGANKVDIITFAFVGAATPHLSMLQDMRNS